MNDKQRRKTRNDLATRQRDAEKIDLKKHTHGSGVTMKGVRIEYQCAIKKKRVLTGLMKVCEAEKHLHVYHEGEIKDLDEKY